MIIEKIDYSDKYNLVILTISGEDFSISYDLYNDLHLNIDDKMDFDTYKKILEDDEIIFMGPGTTMEYVSEYIIGKHLTIFTNSLYLFNELIKIDSLTVRLIGGKYRKITGAFVGPLAIDMIKDLRFQKAFIGVNGINDNQAFTYNEDEGALQKLILDNSSEKFIVADSTKIGKEDFYAFYDIENANVITDDKISSQDLKALKRYTSLIY